MSNARSALEQHHLLYDKTSNTGPWSRALGVFIQASRSPMKADGEQLLQHLRLSLKVAETFWVSAEMGDVMVHAADGLDDLDRFAHEMWPSEQGCLLFEKPWYVKDGWGREIGTQMIVWSRSSQDGHPGMVVYHLTHFDDMRDSTNQYHRERAEFAEMRALTGAWSVNHISWIADGLRVGPPQITITEKRKEEMLELSREIERDLGPGSHTETEVQDTSQNSGRVILSLLMLLGQTIVSKERSDLRPRNPKHAKRMPLPGQVTVIKLRREAEGYQRPDGVSDVEWHHRWLVRGHWRRQYCGPNHPLAVEVAPGQYRASIYVAPHVKGPEGLPFRVTEKVQALVR